LYTGRWKVVLLCKIEFWTSGGKKMKNIFFPHLTGTIFIIWVKLARPLYLPFKDRALKCKYLRYHDAIKNQTVQTYKQTTNLWWKPVQRNILTCDAKMEENIKMRHDKGMDAINQIMSILQKISFGRYDFEIGMVMRTSMHINCILYNTEALTSISIRHTDMLEECDKVFMRRLFEAEQGTPIESFFLETSAWPLRFIIINVLLDNAEKRW
jgi:hypothetical protein